jgi:hypothetical protein
MTTSEKQIEANRRNTQLSTGPNSPEGKNGVRLNALKHGILARETVIATGDHRENEDDFEDLLSRLCTDLDPRGALEELVVQQIAVCYWRLRRVLHADMLEFDRVRFDQYSAAIQNAAAGDGGLRRRGLSFPPADALDNLTRYEKTVHNQLQRALENLSRLQRERTPASRQPAK